MRGKALLCRYAIPLSVVFGSLLAMASPGALYADVKPVRIGATVSLSGKYAEPSRRIQAGYRLWARQINARGGLLNRPA